ncbi:1-phosphatidylinositol 4,5-bisphosphate phosphodiesterase delta-1 isoform X3 [Strongylocentrotus purpuratus]|uniref:Phosphoinositide phospholipase C n=1 Tax=Strongylocentrotus purpuratus TaxID=7668 RepID=A0A7M7N4N2_STRPU|nr:1-phosphatidylinositol 4,5-bisphosphate phosphodiesterase delta-1 isoform X3 [Strongylocentrotus purpuratus]
MSCLRPRASSFDEEDNISIAFEVLQQKEVEQIHQKLKRGTKFTKISPNSTKKHGRTFSLTDDGTALMYTPSKKSSSKATVSLSEIHEIRSGHETDTFRISKNKKKYPKERSFSLIVGNENHTVNLVAPSQDEARTWVMGLRWLKKKSQHIDIHSKQAAWIMDAFRQADVDRDGTVDFDESYKLLKKLNIKIEKVHAKRLFQFANTHSTTTKKGKVRSDALSEDEFVEFYRIITRRPDLQEVFKKYSGDDDYWTPEEFAEFMHEEQKRLEVTPEWCATNIEEYEPNQEFRDQKILTMDGFFLFMMGPSGLIFNPFHEDVYQDMKQPLAHYFINSSHNTYLLDDQLRGPSSTEAYISALQRGCRCVELDCWDGPDNDPIVYHGHTLTSKIKFRDIIEVVDKYAFAASEYPLILSFENHCSVEQQKVMAQICVSILKDKLYTNNNLHNEAAFPSPEELKGKILIKGKSLPPSAATTEDDGEVSDEDEAADIDTEDPQLKAELDKKKTTTKSKDKKKKKLKLAKELSDLVTLASVHYGSFPASKEKYKCHQMSSFGEAKAFGLAEDKPGDYVEHNKIFLSRIYPGGLRTNSSNYSPVPMWDVGAQIVALNFQTPCEEMDLNQGKFLQNGKSGFILKPVFCRKPNMQFNPLKPGDQYTQHVTLKVISGQQLPKPSGSKEVIDPYVKVYVLGGGSKQEFKTEVVENNGFSPTWNQEFSFEVKVPELALIRLVVQDYDMASSNEFIGQYTFPVASMQLGYHHVPILGEKGDDLLPASLFIHTMVNVS